MRLVYLIILLMTPSVALADPVTAFLSSQFFTIGTWVVSYGQVLLFTATMAYGQVQAAKQRKAAARAKAAYNASLEDRTITAVSEDAPCRYVYGRARVGSDVVAMFTTGSKDQYKHLVCIHAAHECDGIEGVWIAGKKLSEYQSSKTSSATEKFSGTSYTLAHPPIKVLSVYSGRGEDKTHYDHTINGSTITLSRAGYGVKVTYSYKEDTSVVSIRHHLGAANDPADEYLHNLLPEKWPATAVLRGFCYSVVTLDLNESAFQSGIPAIEVLLRGKKLYDPRTSVTVWSQNPALAIYDYLTSELCWVDADDLPMDRYITAANACDDVFDFGRRYTINGTITSEEDPASVLERLAQSMAGWVVATTWDVVVGKYIAPIMALDQSDIIGSLSITPGVSDADLYNGVKGQFVGAETNWVATDMKPYSSALFVAADGRELWTDIQFGFTDTIQRAHNLSRIFVEDQRNGYAIKAEFSLKTWKLRVGDRVTMTSPFFGWDNKVFRVTGKKFSPTSAVELTMKEDAESIWDFADAVVVDATQNTGLPDPFYLDPITRLTCESGKDVLIKMADGSIVSRILVSWPDIAVSGARVEVQWSDESEVWQSAVTDDSSIYLAPVKDGELYVIRARAVNTLGTKSDWTYTSHIVVGKAEPPNDISGLSINGPVLHWTGNDDIDLAGYRFRFHYGNNLDWGAAAPLHNGLITESPFNLVVRPSGAVTIMGKAVDASGNESKNSANVFANLGDIPVANVVEVVDFAGFSGTLDACSVSGGVLYADVTDSAYGTDDQSAYGLDNDSFFKLSSYAQMAYTTQEVQFSSALNGSSVTLDIDYTGYGLSIEYRLVSPDPAFGIDADSFYGVDDAPAYGVDGVWQPWPGSVVAKNDIYQWRVTIGSGATRGSISLFKVTVDAPDIVEYLDDVSLSANGTLIPYTSKFTKITTVTSTLQANTSGAVSVHIDKTSPLKPKATAINSSGAGVSGISCDFILKGY
ncbi:MAG: phage tail fiber protein [Burkholderiaceae bacterium]|nr:phage tail fiber protein [Burkholderiaceae bacterium]